MKEKKTKKRLFIALILLDVDGDSERRSNLFQGVEEGDNGDGGRYGR